jgi:predicted nucleic acid-binding protein
MAYRLYIDTSVFGAVFDEEDPDRVALTGTVLRRLRSAPFEAFIGTPVLEEISIAPERLRVPLERHLKTLSPTLIEEGPVSLRLADAYMAARLVPKPKRNDARHIAIATVADLDAIVSWNFHDMVNLKKKTIVHSVNVKFGYRLIDIISPPEVPNE